MCVLFKCCYFPSAELWPSSWGSRSWCGSRELRWGCAEHRSATVLVPERCCWSSRCVASSSSETTPCSPYCPWPPAEELPPGLDCEEETDLLGGQRQRQKGLPKMICDCVNSRVKVTKVGKILFFIKNFINLLNNVLYSSRLYSAAVLFLIMTPKHFVEAGSQN